MRTGPRFLLVAGISEDIYRIFSEDICRIYAELVALNIVLVSLGLGPGLDGACYSPLFLQTQPWPHVPL